jgi:hypothetical protein
VAVLSSFAGARLSVQWTSEAAIPRVLRTEARYQGEALEGATRAGGGRPALRELEP